MKRLFFLFCIVCLLSACTEVSEETVQTGSNEPIRDSNGLLIPEEEGSIPLQKDRANPGDYDSSQLGMDDADLSEEGALWILQTREEHPEWYTCETDRDCSSVKGDCSHSCNANSVNSAGYSDYNRAYSLFCQGKDRYMKNCVANEGYCDEGTCKYRDQVFQ